MIIAGSSAAIFVQDAVLLDPQLTAASQHNLANLVNYK